MSTETKIILKYRRPADCWICPDCEAENNMLLASCAVCGLRKETGVVVLPAWSGEEESIAISHKADERIKNFENDVSRVKAVEPPPKEWTHFYREEESSGNTTTIILVILLIIVLGAVIVFSLETFAMESENSIADYVNGLKTTENYLMSSFRTGGIV